MIDLHCHMLPGVDDGSASEADSLEMGRIAARSGVTAIALTPHCNLPEGQGNYYDGALEARFRRLAMLFRQEGLPVTLYRGMEVFSTPERGGAGGRGAPAGAQSRRHCGKPRGASADGRFLTRGAL